MNPRVALPEIRFPEALPVSGKREEIARLLREHQVLIVCGETGSGKTTQLPKIALSIGRGVINGGGLIGHTQPRRIAASSTAKRIAQELGSPLGVHVGYKVRFNDTLQPGASIKLMTDGILLAEAQGDPELRAYDTIIIDEAHERSLNIDFLLGYLHQLLPRRPDLKLIITSATIDAGRFAQHFAGAQGPAPVVEVSGRLYPVEVRYRPFGDDPKDARELSEAVCDAADELWREGSGDILVFLPGEREIREVSDALRKHLFATAHKHAEVLPLFSRLSQAEQERVFEPSSGRRIVLATNVAETSLTVPGVRYVIDSGLARVKRYSYRNKVEQLQVEPVSQASANQRAGRCGRVADGICIRLYGQKDFDGRPRFTDPEILRSSLAAVILRMKSLGLADIEQFPFIEPPRSKAVADGYALLQELGAVDERNALTRIGTELARLPLDPRIGRMILEARDRGALREVMIIASALSVQDPRERPLAAQEAADNAHRRFADDRSEFVAWLKLWAHYHEQVAHKKSNAKLHQQLKREYLNPLRLREWHDVHAQIAAVVGEHGWRVNSAEATYEQLHCALLAGLLGNVGMKDDEEPHYLGARGIRFFIHPGSPLAKKAGRWVMAAELTETTRLYARTLARIEPQWLEKLGGHLLQRVLSEPHWDAKSARVVAFERGTLYGLPVYHGRRVDFSQRDPQEARRIFIREALVAGDWQAQWPFLAANRKLVRRIEELEHKARRQDVLVDDELIAAYYEQHVPEHVCSGASFDAWYREASRAQPRLLFLSREELMRHEAAGITTEAFPKTLKAAGLELALSYVFEPGSPKDGVTVTVPLYALNQLPEKRLEWLVPGLLKEKVLALLKSLPQKPRARLVPLPEFAQQFVDETPFGEGSLLDALRDAVRRKAQLEVKTADFKLEAVPAHLQFNLRVVDQDGRQLATGRNLARLRAEFGDEAKDAFRALAGLRAVLDTQRSASLNADESIRMRHDTQQSNETRPPAEQGAALPRAQAGEALTTFPAEPLPELMELQRGKQTLFGYPALVDKGAHTELEVFDTAEEAAQQHRAGLRRLFALALREPLRHAEKSLPDFTRMAMDFMRLGSADELRAQIVQVALDRAFLGEPLPASRNEFEQRLAEGKQRLQLISQEIARLVSQTLSEWAQAERRLAAIKPQAAAHQDITAQLQDLMPRRFIEQTPYAQLQHFPRYLKAVQLRIDKLRGDPQRDAQRMGEMAPLLQRLRREQQARKGAPDARLDELRWLLEELRVSLFAQELRTPVPVSVKRLQKVVEQLAR
jgi:ATP-dependent helicase HrpA